MIQIPRIDSNSVSLQELPTLLSSGAPLEFQQHWLPSLQQEFMPGSLSLGYNPQALFGYAILKDKIIANPASQKTDKTWEMGDLFEIFIQQEGHSDYWELHITPENFHLALKLPPVETRAGISTTQLLADYSILLSEFESKVWIEPEQTQWRIAWQIPWSLFRMENPSSSIWKMAFCRYDYGEKGAAPILSSVCPFTQCSFHRSHEWLQFKLA